MLPQWVKRLGAWGIVLGLASIIAAAKVSKESKMPGSTTELATLGGGCFWCLEAVFTELGGVEKRVSGYSGGRVPDPTYQQVCTGTTGHAEVVQVRFDSKKLSFRDLLKVFFTIHDPTTIDRHGADVGTQYRSVIFTHGPTQLETARAVIQDIDRASL